MDTDASRLWQRWQQMTYPSRGLPERESDRSALIRIDGTLGPIFERTFRRHPKGETLSAEFRANLESCQFVLEEMTHALSGDARRYFGPIQLLIRLVLASNE